MNVRLLLAKFNPVGCGILVVRVAAVTVAFFRGSLDCWAFREVVELFCMVCSKSEGYILKYKECG